MQEKEKKRRRALYGTRASSKIFDQAITSRPDYGNQSTAETDKKAIQEERGSKMSCKEWIVISQDNKIKAVFDMFVLFCVCYSCFVNVYYVSFS